MSLEKAFQRAVMRIRNADTTTQTQPSDDLRLQFYGLYKQATHGDASEDAPSWFRVIARRKYHAWHALKGVSQDQAKREYITLVKTHLG